MTLDMQASAGDPPVCGIDGAIERLPQKPTINGFDADRLACIQASLRPAGCHSILVGEVGCGSIQVLVSNRPRRWTEVYLKRDYHRICPVVNRLKNRTRPFAWSEIVATRALDNAEKDVLDHARHHGMREGYLVPVATRGTSVAFVSFAGPSIEMNGVLRDRLEALAGSLYCEIANNDRRAPRLTPREAEILQWIGKGKSDWQIGKILSISAKTVNYHVENAKRKFAVATRVQAVVRAVQAGEVSC